jgi:hypothetical protein
MDPEEAKALTDYLDRPYVRPDGLILKSSFWAALLDAREATGRDLDNGAVVDGQDRSKYWLGAIGYLCFIDEVGSAVCPAGRRPPREQNGVLAALGAWTDLPEREREAIWALRCALAHDYSLVNTNPRRGGAQLDHRFQLHDQPGPLVVLPARRWCGSFDHLFADEDTVVSLREVGTLAEHVAAAVIDAHSEGQLRIRLEGGAPEMRARYFLIYRAPTT